VEEVLDSTNSSSRWMTHPNIQHPPTRIYQSPFSLIHQTAEMESSPLEKKMDVPEERPAIEPLPEAEESSLITKSNTLKTSANALFTTSSYADAITGYDRALDILPSYLDYELAVLKSNIAACHLKLEEWKEAVEAATEALDGLERLDPVPFVTKPNVQEDGNDTGINTQEAVIQELSEDTSSRFETFQRTSGKSLSDLKTLRIKSLLRRAKARHALKTWANLQGSLEDYQALSSMQLTPLDRKQVQRAMRELPVQLEESKKVEMEDMMGKLKQLGNGILKPFGLSTDNFNMIKDENSGGYSLNFDQKGKAS
jgi:tetratricopeptide (TPR) repeat protein